MHNAIAYYLPSQSLSSSTHLARALRSFIIHFIVKCDACTVQDIPFVSLGQLS